MSLTGSTLTASAGTARAEIVQRALDLRRGHGAAVAAGRVEEGEDHDLPAELRERDPLAVLVCQGQRQRRGVGRAQGAGESGGADVVGVVGGRAVTEQQDGAEHERDDAERRGEGQLDPGCHCPASVGDRW